MRRLITTTSIAAILLSPWFALPATGAPAVGGCPGGWDLVRVRSLGIDAETATGIPSLDGNGDGWTCVRTVENHPVEGVFVFRDNTLPA
jgi:hypothetical protein